MLRRFSIDFAIFSMGVDALIVGTSLALVASVRPVMNILPSVEAIAGPVNMPIFLYCLFPLVWVGILASFAIYDGKKHLRVVDEFTMLTLASFLSAVSMAGILYISFRDVSRILFLVFVLTAYGSLILWRSLARMFFRFRKDSPYGARRMLIVGSGPLSREVESSIREGRADNSMLVGLVVTEPLESQEGSENVLGEARDLQEIVRRHNVTDVIISLPQQSFQQLHDAVIDLRSVAVKVWVAMDFIDLALYSTSIVDLAGIPMLDLRAPALSDYQRLVKRGFDLLFGVLGLLAALPVMALAALAIRLEGGGAILFCQERVGENGRLFNILKLRTMVPNAEKLQSIVEEVDGEGNVIHKKKNDPRVTRVGRILRRLSLDELPQLFNVLTGDMSLVGPRPELPSIVQEYKPWQRQRLAVLPGITGWWQVTGRSEKLMHLHTEDDLYYIRNYSLWFDVQIMVRTVWAILIGRGSY